jgi:uncharacterized membrane protein YdbT with pleckstrin-like domain
MKQEQRVGWAERRPAQQQPMWEQHELEPDEMVVYEARPSAYYPVGTTVVTSAVIIGLLGLNHLWWAIPLSGLIHWWAVKQNRYLITDKRIIARVGAFNKEATIIRLRQVTDVIVSRPFAANILDNGQVTVQTASGQKIVIPQQPEPDVVANAIRAGLR